MLFCPLDVTALHAPAVTGAVLAIGNFDGVHKGHQALLAHTKVIAAELGAPDGVLTFEPHPRVYFQPLTPPFRLTPPSLKAERLAESGLDVLYTLGFTAELAHLGPEEFIRKILIDTLRVKAIVIGPDFHFGKGRAGHAETLAAAGLDVRVLTPICDVADDVISATRIRSLIQAGDTKGANALLGWDWQLEGIVCHGDKRGRELGYPTANVPLGETQHPAYGIYAGWVALPDSDDQPLWRPAVANIGIRPMFVAKDALMEAFIFDFTRDLYGQKLVFRPLLRLREEAKFGSLDALLVQMAKDCEQARSLLKAA